MITYAQIENVNGEIPTVPIHGKSYATAAQRVRAFRKLFPGGCIETAILHMEGGTVTIQAVVYDEDGRKLSTGMAQEKEGSSQINRTSFLENCETSAVARALGFLGIGLLDDIASADEVTTAQRQQSTLDKKGQAIIKALCERKGLKVEDAFPFGVESMTMEQYDRAVRRMEKIPDVKKEQPKEEWMPQTDELPFA